MASLHVTDNEDPCPTRLASRLPIISFSIHRNFVSSVFQTQINRSPPSSFPSLFHSHHQTFFPQHIKSQCPHSLPNPLPHHYPNVKRHLLPKQPLKPPP
ncbi:hypothetical protein EYC80_005932 [Monilinia laxa]|uniref:Uncharacterized protein n=1 Tax=Monilinia laxa TaxID=61186 RepID=A0A5N6KFK8_MONLA|nr:hypothetical protein EYC80_005932 [Monilinia laxa]